MIRNQSGQIALKWTINPNGKTVRISDSNQYYTFSPKMHVVMAWVNPEHVPSLLLVREKTCNCNNGTYKNAFVHANMLDVNLWMTGDRHADGHEVTWEEVVENV
jgi:hypothetical protein